MSSRLNILVNFVGSDKLSGAIRNIVGLGKSGKVVLKDMKREATGLERELGRVRKEIAGAGDNVATLVERERELERQIAKANEQMGRQKRLLEIDANADRIRARGGQLQSRGRDNMVQGAALAAPLILAAKAAGDFSSGMVDIQQKADLSTRETEKLRDSILASARAARQMPEDMRSAVDVLSGFGLDPRQAALMVPAIGKLGTAFKVDLADGADAAYANLNNLKVPIAQTSRAFDIMASAGNAGAFEIRDMARHFPGLTSQLRALGDGGLDAVGNLSAALQIARRGTGTADEAANNVKNLLQKINSPATVRAFQKNFGVDLPAELARLKAQGIDTFEAIATITQKATKGDLSKLGYAFEDMQAQGAIRNLVLDLKDYRKIRDDSMKASGTIDAAFNVRMLSDANVSWTAMKGSLSEVAITLGTTLLPVVVTTLGYVNRAAGAVATWARAHPQAASAIIQLVAGLAAFKVGLGAVQFAIGGLFGPLATAYRLFARFQALGGLARVFGVLKVAGLGLGRALLVVGRAMLMNPIGLLVTAIGVAAYLIYRHWDKIKAAFAIGLGYLGKAWRWLKENGRAILFLTGPIGVAAIFIWDNWNHIKRAFDTAKGWLGSAWQWLKSNGRNILQFSGPIGTAALLIWNHWGSIKAAFGGALAFIQGLVGRFVGIGRAIIDGLVTGIKSGAGQVWSALKSTVMGPINFLKHTKLEVRSPSRLFMRIGRALPEGLALGIDRGRHQPMGSMRRLATGVAAAGALSLSPAMAGPPIAARAASPGPAAARNSYHFEFHIHARSGQDAEEIAEEVRKKIEKIMAAKKRSDFGDDD